MPLPLPLPSEAKSDLPWLAFRYVAGELAGDEAAAFERRLDTDQGAREAVAEVVELSGAVALAVGAAVVAGLYPAWAMARTPPAEALREA